VQGADELLEKGVDRIVCVAVNDPWAMAAWAESQGVGDRILMLADGSGEFTKAMGLELDATGFGLGMRSKRYAAVVEDGVVVQLDVDESGGVDVSSCAAVAARL
jgi:peroxiredoxin